MTAVELHACENTGEQYVDALRWFKALASFVKRPLVIDRKLSNEGALPWVSRGLIGARSGGLKMALAVPHLLHKLNGPAAQPSSPSFLKRTALTEEKRRPFLGPGTPCFLNPLPRKYKLLRAELVVGSVTTSESSVLYVFLPLFPVIRPREGGQR